MDEAPVDDARLGGVSAALLLPPGTRAPEADALAGAVRWCGTLFEEVLCVGLGPPPGAPARAVSAGPASALEVLAAALRASGSERLLALDAAAPGAPDLWLALLAAPPADAVATGCAPDAGSAPALPALLRRARALAAAERLVEEGQGALEALAGALGCERLAPEDAAALARADRPGAPGPARAPVPGASTGSAAEG